MHYKNQIDIIKSTLDILLTQVQFIAKNENDQEELYNEVYLADAILDQIIYNDYSTNGMPNTYTDPVEEAMSQLRNAQWTITKYQNNY